MSMRLASVARERLRPAVIWQGLDRLPQDRYYELPFRLWRSVSECMKVGAGKARAKNWLEVLRYCRFTVGIDLWGGDIAITTNLESRNSFERVGDDLQILESSFAVDDRYLREERRFAFERNREEIMRRLHRTPDFASLICNIERWEESERRREDEWGWGVTVLTTTCVVRRPK